ncbi:DUF2235 domain-containing protein [Gilvimarinus sp. F26214L]|uniref:DUF2235 domain-containing protein n=1 Tax=Gilvimarinus sp. DZF01 TaxID=3461371 RepID=UPI004045E995
MKRICIFADGTWNSPEQGGATNVLQMARAVMPHVDGVEQIAFYDWGVGTDRKQLSGGIRGEGIDKNIQDCYRFIVHNYNAGDQLYFFGFSRGAYTVRSLAGFIRNAGLLKRENADKIPAAYKLYRKRPASSGPNSAQARQFRKRYAVADLTHVEFVGVWDTVGALGIPVPFWGTLGERDFLFHDCEPSKIVRHARHALSIDEDREDFTPTLWTPKEGLDLKQVWFAGVHSDVGGGYQDGQLSHCAGRWILKEADACGLTFEPHCLKVSRNTAFDKQHNERKGIYLARGKHVRTIEGPLHTSVKKRWDRNAHGYRHKSRALRSLLDSVDGDWSKIEVVD